MRRMKSYDLIPRPIQVLRRISVQRRGVWTFATIDKNSFVRETKNQRFYVINERFGLCNFDERDPSKTAFRGQPGDYIAADKSNGDLTLVTLTEFKLRFPAPDETVRYMPPTSSDFTRETYEQTQQTNSNTNTTINSSTSTGGSSNARSTTTRTSY